MLAAQHGRKSGRKAQSVGWAALVVGLLLVGGCSSDNGGPAPTNTGQACTAVDQCYPGVKAGALLGDAVCLDKVTGGYCTHFCTQDNECCAAAGECPGNHPEGWGP